MPTLAGLPQAGDQIEWIHNGKKVGQAEVMRRSSGTLWGMSVLWRRSKIERWISEADCRRYDEATQTGWRLVTEC
jgi:hypothetical protein